MQETDLSHAEATRPLAGICVLEMGSSVAGPHAGWVLSELGAEVLKLEDPHTGDATRSWGDKVAHGHSAIFETLNNGKKSLAVDLKNPQHIEAVKTLVVDRVDVVLQNLRPGFASQCGIGQADLIAAKPALIYCDMGAYGKGGPLSELPGYDPLMQGFTGIAQGTGSADSPARVCTPVTDFVTGMWCVIGILSALQRRHECGHGAAVDVSLMESGIGLMTMFVGLYQTTGKRLERNGLQGPLVAPNGGFQTRDGLIMIVCGTNALFARLCRALDLEALLDDERFVSSTARHTYRHALQDALELALKRSTREHWMNVLGGAGVPVSPVHHVDEMMRHPQAQAVNILQTLSEDARAGNEPFTTARLPIRFGGERRGYTARGPELGEHNHEFLPNLEL
jgi:crotonobetainyl-CoA:carnitine CoA-transferase CaiB-like acyl-CoA transferase